MMQTLPLSPAESAKVAQLLELDAERRAAPKPPWPHTITPLPGTTGLHIRCGFIGYTCIVQASPGATVRCLSCMESIAL